MSQLRIEMFPCLDDNYGFLLHDPATGLTAAIDTPDPVVIEAELERRGWRLTHIFNTHHYGDHAGGNVALKARCGCKVGGPRADAARIPGIDGGVVDGDSVDFGGHATAVCDPTLLCARIHPRERALCGLRRTREPAAGRSRPRSSSLACPRRSYRAHHAGTRGRDESVSTHR